MGIRAVGIAVAGLLLIGAHPAYAAGDAQRFTITGSGLSGVAPSVAAAGVVNGHGADVPLTLELGPDGTTLSGTDRLDFAAGSVLIAFRGALGVDTDPRTCVSHIALDGTYTVAGGTGAYAGASGGGTFTDHEIVLADRTRAGCGTPRLNRGTVSLTGTLHLVAAP